MCIIRFGNLDKDLHASFGREEPRYSSKERISTSSSNQMEALLSKKKRATAELTKTRSQADMEVSKERSTRKRRTSQTRSKSRSPSLSNTKSLNATANSFTTAKSEILQRRTSVKSVRSKSPVSHRGSSKGVALKRVKSVSRSVSPKGSFEPPTRYSFHYY